ncbi:MAG: hypothetical protein ACP5IZ_10850 [Thermoprotei archaeon]
MKKIEIMIDENGMKIIYDGFIGDECFIEAKKLYEKLSQLGVDVTIITTQKTTSESGVKTHV